MRAPVESSPGREVVEPSPLAGELWQGAEPGRRVLGSFVGAGGGNRC